MKNESQKVLDYLKNVFEDYEKTENNLKAINQKLLATEQQLKAANQQLRTYNQQLIATEQQIRATNQQLLATEQQLRAANQQLKASNLEIRQKEKEAVAAKEFVEDIISTLRESLLVLDEDFKVITANESFYKTFNTTPKDTLGHFIFEIGNKQWNIPVLKKLLFEILPDNSEIVDFEVKHLFDDIEQKTILINSRELIQEGGKKKMILIAMEDITKRKQYEEDLLVTNQQLKAANQQLSATEQQLRAINIELSASEQRFRKYFEQSLIGMTITSTDTRWIETNDVLCKMLGYSKEELYKLTWIELTHPDDIEADLKQFNRLLANEIDSYILEKRFIHKDGHLVYTAISVNAYHNTNDKSVEYVLALVHNITKLKLAEEQIKKDIKIKTALIHEIYHRTKNNMAVISAMLSIQARFSDNEYVKSTFREIRNKIKAMSLVHQKLYQAKDLSNINLKDYIKDLTSLIMQSYGSLSKKIKVKLDLQDVKASIDSAVPLGLIVNELISNIFKHAFPNNQEGEIFIRLSKKDNEKINLELCDNGVGFPKNFNPCKNGSMGLTSVFSIVENQLKGEISVISEHGLKWHIKIKDNLKKARV